MISQTLNHVTEALSLLLTQFKGKPGIEELITAYVTQLQELEDAFADLLNNRTIETAEGVQLDGLGKLIGLQRETLWTDTEYRLRLRVQILINLSSGTVPELLEIFDRLLASPFSVLPSGTATIIVTIFEAITEDEANALVDTLADAKAAGVKAFLTYVLAGSGPFFSFGPDPDVEGESFGFDDGAFAGTLES